MCNAKEKNNLCLLALLWQITANGIQRKPQLSAISSLWDLETLILVKSPLLHYSYPIGFTVFSLSCFNLQVSLRRYNQSHWKQKKKKKQLWCLHDIKMQGQGDPFVHRCPTVLLTHLTRHTIPYLPLCSFLKTSLCLHISVLHSVK